MKNSKNIKLSSTIESILYSLFFCLYFLSPVYKYFEIKGSLPQLNLSLIRFVIFIPIFLLFFVKLTSNLKNYKQGILAVFFLLYFTFILISVFSYFTYDYIRLFNYDYFNNLNSILVNYFMFFTMGIFLSHKYAKNKKKLANGLKLVWLAYFIFCFSIIANLFEGYGGNLLGITQLNYINFSDNFAFLTLLVIGLENNNLYRLILFFTTIIILFFIPSRATLIAFLFTNILFIIFESKFIKRYFFQFSILAFLIFAFSKYLPTDIIENNRIYRTNISGDDSSLEKRNEILNKNFEIISDNILFGKFMGSHELYGESGLYIHSYLSLLQQFGIFLFLIFIFFYFSILRKLFWIFKRRDKKDLFRLILLLFVFISIQITFARSYQNPYIWIIFGLLAYKRTYQIENN